MEAIPTEPKRTWTEPGPGRRQCGTCKVYCGVRSKACPACGADFQAAALAEQAAKRAVELAAAQAAREARAARERAQATEQPVGSTARYVVTGGREHPHGVVVIAESGPPPVPCPAVHEESTVQTWAAACVSQTSDYLTVGALLLWLRRYDTSTRQWLGAVPGVAVEVSP